MPGLPHFLRVLLLASWALPNSLPFNITCTEWSHNQTLLTGNCNAHVAASSSALDLNHCFANVDGTLVPSDDGFFGDSCGNISIDKWLDGTKRSPNPVVLRADCRDKSGKLVPAAIEISAPGANVNNNDGRLQCYDHDACFINMRQCIGCGETGGLKPPSSWRCD